MLGRRVRRRDAQWVEMPVLWPSPKRFYASAQTGVQRNGDTWVGEPFAGKAFDILAEADSEIPGLGMHTVVWDRERHRYLYPFDHEFEGILRGLQYIPAYLARAWEKPEFARSVVQTTGGCLEGCVKDMFRSGPKRHVYSQRPLGSLARTAHAKKALGAELAVAIAEFADATANPAKHDYQTGRGARRRFSFDDAVSAYFLARVLGATDRIDPLIAATRLAVERGEFFRGASLSLGPPGSDCSKPHRERRRP